MKPAFYILLFYLLILAGTKAAQHPWSMPDTSEYTLSLLRYLHILCNIF